MRFEVKGSLFYEEKDCFSGVKKIAARVREDMKAIFGKMPETVTEAEKLGAYAVIYGTIGNSMILEQLEKEGKLSFAGISGKREVYLFQLVENPIPGVKCAVVIAGSDKRGTIYGLFHLSELIGVSPLSDWCDISPEKQESVILTEHDNRISKEPSVRFRGFFINDEWPAFGNWTEKRFGGFHANMYVHVFELLLRLKGNYLWPAMWSARFSEDGPGLLSAELADEYGVIMGMSHHEPCLRHGEEYRYLRGKDSVYGDAWNFRTNEAGITKFWEDGLKRNGSFENVITVGMRGEQDSAIMGKDATLADNIELLSDVLKTQNQLIRQYVNRDLEQVPRMLALYKEVEPYFYGDETTKGLIGSPELDGVTLMLCDDNFGNLRTLPTEEMRAHPGGYGMYYHFDYHGLPISYEWINSSFLPKVWEQMTTAYEFGVRDLWIVNVGDIFTNEFPLSYFLTLAYDFEQWGTQNPNSTDTYTKQWISAQFHGAFGEREQKEIFELLSGYTKIAHNRRPEAMNDDIYHPVNYGEADGLLATIDEMLLKAETLYMNCRKENQLSFFSLVYYPVVGNLNLQKMQLLTGKNHFYAKMGCVKTNETAELVKNCMKTDRELVKHLHEIGDGRWYGMGMSQHIGFRRWNEEECRNPVLMYLEPADKPRLIVSLKNQEEYTEGGVWTGKALIMEDFLEPDCTESAISLNCAGSQPVKFRLSCDQKFLSFSKKSGLVNQEETIVVQIDRSKMGKESEALILIEAGEGKSVVLVKARREVPQDYPRHTYPWCKNYIAIEAEHYVKNEDTSEGHFVCLENYGRTLSAMKPFPVTSYFVPGVNAPWLTYQFVLEDAGEYEIDFYLAPSNPVTNEKQILFGLQLNEAPIGLMNAIPDSFKVEDRNACWEEGVLENIRITRGVVECEAGLNTLRVYACSPGFVLERIVIFKISKKPAESYLGPAETYYIGRESEKTSKK